VPTLISVLAVAMAYVALGGLSAVFAYADTDAWSVWLASGLTLGLLLARPRPNWLAILAGAALGAIVFGLLTGSGLPARWPMARSRSHPRWRVPGRPLASPSFHCASTRCASSPHSPSSARSCSR
jgi:hypothetical protein